MHQASYPLRYPAAGQPTLEIGDRELGVVDRNKPSGIEPHRPMARVAEGPDDKLIAKVAERVQPSLGHRGVRARFIHWIAAIQGYPCVVVCSTTNQHCSSFVRTIWLTSKSLVPSSPCAAASRANARASVRMNSCPAHSDFAGRRGVGRTSRACVRLWSARTRPYPANEPPSPSGRGAANTQRSLFAIGRWCRLALSRSVRETLAREREEVAVLGRQLRVVWEFCSERIMSNPGIEPRRSTSSPSTKAALLMASTTEVLAVDVGEAVDKKT